MNPDQTAEKLAQLEGGYFPDPDLDNELPDGSAKIAHLDSGYSARLRSGAEVILPGESHYTRGKVSRLLHRRDAQQKDGRILKKVSEGLKSLPSLVPTRGQGNSR